LETPIHKIPSHARKRQKPWLPGLKSDFRDTATSGMVSIPKRRILSIRGVKVKKVYPVAAEKPVKIRVAGMREAAGR